MHSFLPCLIILQIVRIDQTMTKGEFLKVENLVKSFQHAKDTSGRLHLLGLVSDGGVHSNQEHLYELLKTAKTLGVPHIYIHFFGDGRDTDPKSAAVYMKQLLAKIEELEMKDQAKMATIVGRYWAMDRDKRWDRVEIALKGVIGGEGESTDDPISKIEERYSKNENDEFLKPIILNGDEARVKGKHALFNMLTN